MFSYFGKLFTSVVLFVAFAAPVHAVELHWYGQAAFKITTPGGKVIVIDPFITKNPKTPEDQKDLAKIGKVDLILVTHGHFDHTADITAADRWTLHDGSSARGIRREESTQSENGDANALRSRRNI